MKMTQSWQKALDLYRYRVDLADFKDAQMYPDWFEYDTGNGDRANTMGFEEWFREFAPHHLEAWYEVVFWKLYSQPSRRDRITPDAIANVERSRLTAGDLWNLCHDYIGSPSSRSFTNFRKHFFDSNVIATAATFPAFICPKKFPMVDKHIARWASDNVHNHLYQIQGRSITLPMKDNVNSFDQFVRPWYRWCRITACILTKRTGNYWRARDVEMAVFTAQRSGFPLNPLS